MEKIKWVTAKDIFRIHDDIIMTSGGLPGINAHASVHAIAARVENHAYYVGVSDFIELAALLAVAIWSRERWRGIEI